MTVAGRPVRHVLLIHITLSTNPNYVNCMNINVGVLTLGVNTNE